MLREPPANRRRLHQQSLQADLAVVGGGLAGFCAAVTAARAGIRVTLLHDRPVLGGNASSEVRMVVLGATASMANNNRFAREGGLIDEFLLENVFRNPQGNPLLSDALLLEMAIGEPNLTLLLNTAAMEVTKESDAILQSVRGYCSQNETLYEVCAPLFCDASGDGVLGYLAGAALRMGAETREEYGEPLAPDEAYGHLLGQTILFSTKDIGKPVPFVRPSFALVDITRITRWERIRLADQGRDYWWIEYGGRLDTVHDTEAIKWELWRIVWGVWDHIKNSGRFPDAQTRTLEWVGAISGKRESRRFEGEAMLTQQDVLGRRRHADAVSYGGWSVDLHPADGVYSQHPTCRQWHAKGIYTIPYRALYSRNIRNLFLAGRVIGASHVALGSTRVMATCAHTAQAVGMAAALCRREGLLPANLAHGQRIGRLQLELARTGQFIPGYVLQDPDDLARSASITASSRLRLGQLPPDGPLCRLDEGWAMLLPLRRGPVPRVAFQLDTDQPTRLRVELRAAAEPDSFTPEVTLAVREVALPAGADQTVWVDFQAEVDAARYAFVCLGPNPSVHVRTSRWLITGVRALVHRGRADVTSGATQSPPEGLGVERFEFWRPLPLPEGNNLALALEPPLDVFAPESVANGVARPTSGPNAWVADPADPSPTLTLRWERPQSIARLELTFDTDRDNPLFSVQFEHPERVMPQCVRQYRILDGRGRVLAARADNHQTRNTVRLDPAVQTDTLCIELVAPGPTVPAALHEVRCYGPAMEYAKSVGYSAQELAGIPEGVVCRGCGNPTALAALKEGETVLDMGAGSGLDAFLAARRIGPQGKVIGVDASAEMVARATENAAKGNYANVVFIQGEFGNLPLGDESVDVVISNCVLNYAGDKLRAFKELFRCLKPKGRIVVTDLVAEGCFCEEVFQDKVWGTWLAGALGKQDYLKTIEKAGFRDAVLIKETPFPMAESDERLRGRIVSLAVIAYK